MVIQIVSLNTAVHSVLQADRDLERSQTYRERAQRKKYEYNDMEISFEDNLEGEKKSEIRRRNFREISPRNFEFL